MRASALTEKMMRTAVGHERRQDQPGKDHGTGDKLDMDKPCSKAGGCLNNRPEPDDEPGR
jgi:hypothetical protein